MAGIVVFKSLADAVRAGFELFDRTATVYVVRMRTDAGWALALAEARPLQQPEAES